MNDNNGKIPQRAGEAYRSNPDRYFHVMAQGWFVFTREGIRGPFVDQPKARSFLSNHIKDIQSENDPTAAWRL